MSDYKIKNREALLSHGDAGAKAQVLELTERVLHRLDARKRLHEMMHREGSELVIGSRRHDLSQYRHVYAFSSGRWKLVIRPSMQLNFTPGYRKIEVLPLQARISPYFAATASSVRQLVVPTAITR